MCVQKNRSLFFPLFLLIVLGSVVGCGLLAGVETLPDSGARVVYGYDEEGVQVLSGIKSGLEDGLEWLEVFAAILGIPAAAVLFGGARNFLKGVQVKSAEKRRDEIAGVLRQNGDCGNGK